MPPDNSQEAVIAFLSKPESYGLEHGTRIGRIETHGAIVFLVGEYAYKLKRAVKYPYMDYSTPEKRKEMCEREFEINRRTAPDIYLEVRSVMQGIDSYLRFGPGEAAAARDHVVIMRRFDQANLFGNLCAKGKLTPELMRKTAETIASFHDNAKVTTQFGGARGIADVVSENNAILAGMTGAPFDAGAVAAYARASESALRQVSALLDKRQAAGKVRRCHGDLHLDNVVLHDGKPVLFDAIEFNDAFASIDVLYDLAFLLMDLEYRGERALSHALFNRYLEISGDYDGLAALPLFLACRAAIRAHVAVSRAAATGKKPGPEARRYLNLAQRVLTPGKPRLAVIAGLSGTGKTTVARLVAPPLGRAPGAVILRSDVTRKRMLGISEETRAPESAYTQEMSARVFHAMAETAKAVLAAGHSVVMDAVYGTQDERGEIEGVARAAGAGFDGFWLAAEPSILTHRIAGRRHDASDATTDVLKKQIAQIAAPTGWNRIDASGAPETIANTILAKLRPES